MQNDVLYNRIMKKIDELEPGGGGALIVNVTNVGGVYTMDKTYAEIYDAFKSGTPCFAIRNESSDDPIDSLYAFRNCFDPITVVYKYNDIYRINTNTTQSAVINDEYVGVPAIHVFQASISSDYPTFLRTVYTKEANVSVTSNYG